MVTASDFLSPFFPNEHEPINLRALRPRGAPETSDNQPQKLTVTRRTLTDDKRLQERLALLNETHGLYFVVNSGGDSDTAITGGDSSVYGGDTIKRFPPGRYNACFAESDDASIEDQHAALDACPLPPSIRVETQKSVHAYWLLAGDNPGDKCEATWRAVQLGLIGHFGGDPKIKNPARLMRLPGSDHLTYDKASGLLTRKPVLVHTFRPDRRYTLEVLAAAFASPTTAHPQSTKTKLDNDPPFKFADWGALRRELGRRIMEHPTARKNSNDRWDCRGVCHDGEGTRGLFYDPAKNQAYCNKGCTQAVVLRAFGLPERPGKDGDAGVVWKNEPARSEGQKGDQAGGRISKAKRLILLVESSDADLFHNSEGRTFATVRVGSHFETIKLESSGFKQWCEHEYWRTFDSGIHASGFKEALGVLRANALYEGACREVHMRVAGHLGNVYLDLGDPDWRQIEITRARWRIIEGRHSPVRFRRAPGMLPLPMPTRGGKVEELRPFLNAQDDETWVLLVAWLVMCFNPRGPYPVLIINGEQGSAKSTTTRFLRDLIDPNTAGLRAAPREERDFYIAGNNSYTLTFDNMSGLTRDWSDALCRVATGGALAVRTLYSDDDETIFNLMRPLVLNGIEDIATRGDLLNRAVIITLPPLPSASRRDEREIHKSFEEARPRILGALLDVVVVALSKYHSVKLSELPRMADFARWITAAEQALGLEPGVFMRIYARNQEAATDIALESSLVAQTLQAIMDARLTGEWRGTATKLLAELNEELISKGDDPKKTRGWPQSARALGNVLRRLSPHLRAAGMSIATGERAGKNRDRLIIITQSRDNAGDSLSASSAVS